MGCSSKGGKRRSKAEEGGKKAVAGCDGAAPTAPCGVVRCGATVGVEVGGMWGTAGVVAVWCGLTARGGVVVEA